MLRNAINAVQYENDDASYSNNVRQWIPNNVHLQTGQIQYSATKYEPVEWCAITW